MAFDRFATLRAIRFSPAHSVARSSNASKCLTDGKYLNFSTVRLYGDGRSRLGNRSRISVLEHDYHVDNVRQSAITRLADLCRLCRLIARTRHDSRIMRADEGKTATDENDLWTTESTVDGSVRKRLARRIR